MKPLPQSPISYVGNYKIKHAPPLRNSNESIFDRGLFASEEDTANLAAAFGYVVNTPKRYYPPVWLYVPRYVEPHTDSSGTCLLYLHSGKGSLHVVHKGKIHSFYMSKGNVVIFNDKLQHFWLSKTPCKMLATSVKKRKDNETIQS